MIYKKVPLPFCGERVNGRAFDGNIVLYISKGGAVYTCAVNGYAENAPDVSGAAIKSYCDEICPLPCGGYAERRGNIIKIRY